MQPDTHNGSPAGLSLLHKWRRGRVSSRARLTSPRGDNSPTRLGAGIAQRLWCACFALWGFNVCSSSGKWLVQSIEAKKEHLTATGISNPLCCVQSSRRWRHHTAALRSDRQPQAATTGWFSSVRPSMNCKRLLYPCSARREQGSSAASTPAPLHQRTQQLATAAQAGRGLRGGGRGRGRRGAVPPAHARAQHLAGGRLLLRRGYQVTKTLFRQVTKTLFHQVTETAAAACGTAKLTLYFLFVLEACVSG